MTQTGADDIYTSSICEYEVLLGERYRELKGMKTSMTSAAGLFRALEPLKLTPDDASTSAVITAKLMSKGKMVDDFDVLIAAQAIDKHAVMLTKDAKHFKVLNQEADLQIFII